MEDTTGTQVEEFLQAASSILTQIRAGGSSGLTTLPSHSCPGVFNLGLEIARQGAARQDIEEIIQILLASSEEAYRLDPLTRFAVAVLWLVLDGEAPGTSRLDRERLPLVFAVSPGGVETPVDWTGAQVSSLQDLVIRGDVRDGLTVKSSRSIRIAGQVGAAYIEAGGGIDVEGCVFGKGKASLRCGDDFRATAFERARLSAGGDVRVGAVVEAVELACGGDLFCEGGSSAILGGEITAGGSIRAGTVGGPFCVQTDLTAGDQSLTEGRRSERSSAASGTAAITVLGTIYERVQLKVGQSRMSVGRQLSGVTIRENGMLLRMEACDAL